MTMEQLLVNGGLRAEVIVCLGATAAHAVIGKQHSLLKERGKFFEHPMARLATATVHPSAVLRAPDAERRRRDYEAFVGDLVGVAHVLSQARASGS